MKKIIFTLVLAASVLSSCSLKETPEYFVNKDNYYKDVSQCRASVNSLYVGMRNMLYFKFFTLTEATADLCYEPAPSVPDARMEISPSQPGYGETIWEQCYKMVMYANSHYAGISSAPIEANDKACLLAEVAVMRAFYYYLLTSFFGDVPFYYDEVANSEVMERVAHLPRMSAQVTRKTLIDELNGIFSYSPTGEYTSVVPRERTCDAKENRSGWALGEMLIAKMALWNACKEENPDVKKDWYNVACTACSRLEEVYGEFNELRYPLEDVMFRYKNTPESILEVQHDYQSGGVQYYSNLSSVLLPTKKMVTVGGVNVYLWGCWSNDNDVVLKNGKIIEELGDDATQYTATRPNIYFASGMQPNDGKDRRTAINVAWGYRIDEDGQIFTDGSQGSKFYDCNTRAFMGRKFWCPHLYNTYDSNNYKIFRYADVLLMKAEAFLGLGNTDKAVEYVNKVRARAASPNPDNTLQPIVYKNDKKLFSDIQDERGRELFGEFQRKFDLVRWGIWYDTVTQCSDYAELVSAVRPCHEYLPIPDKQVIYSGNALDNKEYNKYGL